MGVSVQKITRGRGFLALSTLVSLLATSVNAGSTVEDMYQENCAGCHGVALQGGSAKSLAKGEFTQGDTQAAIQRSIASGIDKVGMPAFSPKLSQSSIRALSVYIKEKRHSSALGAKHNSSNKDRPLGETYAFTSEGHNYTLQKVFEGSGRLWALDILPKGDILATQQNGTLWHYKKNQGAKEIKGIPAVRFFAQGGLLDLIHHPNYRKNGWIYLSYSMPEINEKSFTRVVRGKIKKGRWSKQQTIYEPPLEDQVGAGHHYGSRFAFKDGFLYFSVGDRGEKQQAQNLKHSSGKIHRVHDNGNVPKDNPFTGTIWSYGHRNPQGLFYDNVSKVLWSTEHGPRGGDELNTIIKAANYAWPLRTMGIHYDGRPFPWHKTTQTLRDPVLHFTPSIGISNLIVYRGKKFPQWQGNLLITSLAKQELHRVVIHRGEVTAQHIVFKDVGRIRDIALSKDGDIFLIINPDDVKSAGAVYRLVGTK